MFKLYVTIQVYYILQYVATIGMLIYSTVWTARENKKNNINLKVSQLFRKCNTVKPVLRGHPWDKEKVAL